jgi:hypothetical protein
MRRSGVRSSSAPPIFTSTLDIAVFPLKSTTCHSNLYTKPVHTGDGQRGEIRRFATVGGRHLSASLAHPGRREVGVRWDARIQADIRHQKSRRCRDQVPSARRGVPQQDQSRARRQAGGTRSTNRGRGLSDFFAKLTRRRLKHGVFHSLVDLQAAINRFIADYNVRDAKPFIWKADPDDIIAARNRGFQMLESIH